MLQPQENSSTIVVEPLSGIKNEPNQVLEKLLKSLNFNLKTYARLSAHTYDHSQPLPEGWEIFLNSDKDTYVSLINNASYSRYSSGFHGTAYYNKLSENTIGVVIAFTGTDFSNHRGNKISNFVSDFALACCLTPLSQHYAEEFYLQVQEKLKKRFPNQNIIIELTGHSLGGAHVQHVATIHTHVKGITFEAVGLYGPFSKDQNLFSSNVINCVMHPNFINKINRRVGVDLQLLPNVADELALQSCSDPISWLLKCHAIETCINAFDADGVPLSDPIMITRVLQEVPDPFVLDEELKRELFCNIARNLGLLSKEKIPERTMQQLQDEASSIKNFTVCRDVSTRLSREFFSLVKSSREPSKLSFLPAPKDENITKEKQALPKQPDQNQCHSETFQEEKKKDKPPTTDTKEKPQQEILCYSGKIKIELVSSLSSIHFYPSLLPNQDAVTDVRQQNIQILASLFQGDKKGSFIFAPMLGLSIPFDLTLPPLVGFSITTCVGIMAYNTVQEWLKNWDKSGCLPCQKAQEALEVSIRNAVDAWDKRFSFKKFVRSLFNKFWKEIPDGNLAQVKAAAENLIAESHGNPPVVFICRAYQYAINQPLLISQLNQETEIRNAFETFLKDTISLFYQSLKEIKLEQAEKLLKKIIKYYPEIPELHLYRSNFFQVSALNKINLNALEDAKQMIDMLLQEFHYPFTKLKPEKKHHFALAIISMSRMILRRASNDKKIEYAQFLKKCVETIPIDKVIARESFIEVYCYLDPKQALALQRKVSKEKNNSENKVRLAILELANQLGEAAYNTIKTIPTLHTHQDKALVYYALQYAINKKSISEILYDPQSIISSFTYLVNEKTAAMMKANKERTLDEGSTTIMLNQLKCNEPDDISKNHPISSQTESVSKCNNGDYTKNDLSSSSKKSPTFLGFLPRTTSNNENERANYDPSLASYESLLNEMEELYIQTLSKFNLN